MNIIGDTVDRLEIVVNSRDKVPFPTFQFSVLGFKETEKNDQGILIELPYRVVYDYQTAGKITLEGKIYVLASQKESEEMSKSYTLNRKLPDNVMSELMTAANYIATIHSTVVTQTVRFRAPVLPVRLNYDSKT